MSDTTIKVGTTREDGYGNLWVAPAGGGDEVKISVKRNQLHPLFQQGATVLLHWETYKNKLYVANAEVVIGEPPPVTEAEKPATEKSHRADPQEIGMWQKEVGEWLRSGKLHEWVEEKKVDKATAIALNTQYWAKMFVALEVKGE